MCVPLFEIIYCLKNKIKKITIFLFYCSKFFGVFSPTGGGSRYSLEFLAGDCALAWFSKL